MPNPYHDARGRFTSKGSARTSSGNARRLSETQRTRQAMQPTRNVKTALQVWNEKVANGTSQTPQWAKDAQARWDAEKAATKAKPSPLRTASGTVLNRHATLNTPATTPAERRAKRARITEERKLRAEDADYGPRGAQLHRAYLGANRRMRAAAAKSAAAGRDPSFRSLSSLNDPYLNDRAARQHKAHRQYGTGLANLDAAQRNRPRLK